MPSFSPPPGPPRIVVLSGSPVSGSRTWCFAAVVARRLEAQGLAVRLLDLRALPAAGLLHGPGDDAGPVRAALDEVRRADGVVVATPVHHAAYSGLLKAFLDLLPRGGLHGKVALPLAVGGAPEHVLVIDYALRPVLVSLGAAHVTRGHFLVGAELERPTGGPPRLRPRADQRLDEVLGEFVRGLRLHADGQAGPPPSADTLPLHPDALAARLLQRVNRGSDLWQQRALLADMLLVRDDGSLEWRESLPVPYIRDRHARQGDHCFVLTLELVPRTDGAPSGCIPARGDDGERAADGSLLHPAIREYDDGVQISEHRVVGDREARWGAEHVEPLLSYLRQRIRQRRVRVERIVGTPAGAAAREPAGG